MIFRSLRAASALAVLTLTLGCANAATQGRSGQAASNTLTYEQLARTNSENLYEAITRLRPSWFTTRGPTSVTNSTPSAVSVFANGTLLGNADYLQQVRIVDVTEVKYWDAASASARFGMGHPRGVIEIIRK